MPIAYGGQLLLPVWFVPGAADYVMHRRTRIERTSGLPESLIHSLMMAGIAVPLTLTLLCEVISFLESLLMMAGVGPGMPALGSGIHPAGYVPAG